MNQLCLPPRSPRARHAVAAATLGHRARRRLSGALTLACGLGAIALAPPAAADATTPSAIDVRVTTLTDTLAVNDNACSLREAIAAVANGFQTTGTLPSGCVKTQSAGANNSVSFAPALTATGPATLRLTQFDIVVQVSRPISINGPGADLLTIDAAGDSRVFETRSGGVGLSGMTLTGGKTVEEDGGAILAGSALTLSGVRITGNQAGGSGGAIHLQSADGLTISDSEVSGNTAAGDGGAIRVGVGAPIRISNSRLTGNQAEGDGGAIDIFPDPQTATVSLFNTTVSGNSARGQGGGLRMDDSGGTLEISASTLADNSAEAGAGLFLVDVATTVGSSTLSGNAAGISGGGLHVRGGTLTVSSASLVGNTAGTRGDSIFLDRSDSPSTFSASNSLFTGASHGACESTSGAPMTSGTGNLVASTTGEDRSCSSSDSVARRVTLEALRLGPLADNGGAAPTHALGTGSVAIDRGSATGCAATDQRGVPRPQNGVCDVGAFEVTTPASFADRSGRPILIEADAGHIESPGVLPAPPLGAPSGFAFPHGFFSYRVTSLPVGATVSVTITLPVGSKPTAVFKCSATGDRCVQYGFAAIDKNKVRLTLVDGGEGDSDLRQDGVITDPVGIAVPEPNRSTEVLDTGGALGGLGVLTLALAGALRVRSRKLPA